MYRWVLCELDFVRYTLLPPDNNYKLINLLQLQTGEWRVMMVKHVKAECIALRCKVDCQ